MGIAHRATIRPDSDASIIWSNTYTLRILAPKVLNRIGVQRDFNPNPSTPIQSNPTQPNPIHFLIGREQKKAELKEMKMQFQVVKGNIGAIGLIFSEKKFCRTMSW